MSASVDISVVVPVLNAGPYLERCLDALGSQSYAGPYEVIVVDNGSTDDSQAIAARHADVQRLDEPERGSYAARNRGVAAARGAILAFLDPDCLPARDWLANIAAAMQDAGTGVVLGARRMPSGSAALSLIEAYELHKDEYVFSGPDAALFYGYTNNMAVRRRLFDELGPFVQLPRGADAMFVQRVIEAHSIDIVQYRPDVVVTHMEVDGPAVYYRKVFLYARHRSRVDAQPSVQSLNTRQRLEIFRRVRQHQGYSFRRAAHLFVLLVLGFGAWHVGRWSRRL